jgi:hypothetical protein
MTKYNVNIIMWFNEEVDAESAKDAEAHIRNVIAHKKCANLDGIEVYSLHVTEVDRGCS